MRFIDLAVGGMIAVSSLIALVAWNPQASDIAARRSLDAARLRDSMTAFIRNVGIVQLIHYSPANLCSLLRSISNSTVTLSAEEDGISCNPPPPGIFTTDLTVTAGTRVVKLESWYNAGR